MIRWIDLPGFDGCVANGVAPDGTVVGVVREATGRVRGFVLDPVGGMRLFDAPGAADSFLQDVAPGGLVIGDCTDGSRYRAFVLRGDDVAPVEPPGAVEAWAGGILRNGDCCGAWRDGSGRRAGFRRLGGRFEDVLPPGADSAVLHGMGEGGEVVGACSLATELAGFLQRPDGTLEWLDPPRGEFVPSDCALGGAWIVGHFRDRDGASQAGELRDGKWRAVEIPGGPWQESSLVGCCPGVGVAGWALGADGVKRGFVTDAVAT